MKNRYRWWHGVLFYGAVRAAAYGLKAASSAWTNRRTVPTGEEDHAMYEAERLPAFAPPPLAYPVAWGINSVCAIYGGLHVLNLPENTPGRAQFLRGQGAAWVLFSMFEAAYFGLRSPINAAAVTTLYTAATAASLDAAWRRMQDSKAALSLASTAAWLVLANPVGLTQAAWNRDPLWHAGPFAEPDPRWLKDPNVSSTALRDRAVPTPA
jgi:tryptophan-rich sensory protein